MISSVIPLILMSICRAVTPLSVPATLIHVAEVVFVTEDVGQDGELLAFLDQAHGDTGDRRLDRHTGIHQREGGAAHGGHRAGTVGLGDLETTRMV